MKKKSGFFIVGIFTRIFTIVSVMFFSQSGCNLSVVPTFEVPIPQDFKSYTDSIQVMATLSSKPYDATTDTYAKYTTPTEYEPYANTPKVLLVGGKFDNVSDKYSWAWYDYNNKKIRVSTLVNTDRNTNKISQGSDIVLPTSGTCDMLAGFTQLSDNSLVVAYATKPSTLDGGILYVTKISTTGVPLFTKTLFVGSLPDPLFPSKRILTSPLYKGNCRLNPGIFNGVPRIYAYFTYLQTENGTIIEKDSLCQINTDGTTPTSANDNILYSKSNDVRDIRLVSDNFDTYKYSLNIGTPPGISFQKLSNVPSEITQYIIYPLLSEADKKSGKTTVDDNSVNMQVGDVNFTGTNNIFSGIISTSLKYDISSQALISTYNRRNVIFYKFVTTTKKLNTFQEITNLDTAQTINPKIARYGIGTNLYIIAWEVITQRLGNIISSFAIYDDAKLSVTYFTQSTVSKNIRFDRNSNFITMPDGKVVFMVSKSDRFILYKMKYSN